MNKGKTRQGKYIYHNILSIPLFLTGASMATLVLYLVAKFAESAAFLIIYPFAAEQYPTEVRGVGIGFSAYVGGLGLVIIPFINYLVGIVGVIDE